MSDTDDDILVINVFYEGTSMNATTMQDNASRFPNGNGRVNILTSPNSLKETDEHSNAGNPEKDNVLNVAFHGIGLTQDGSKERLAGELFGAGLEDRMQGLYDYIEEALKAGRKIRLNAGGASRGGKGVELLAKKFQHIPRDRMEMHLLLLDPTPGTSKVGHTLNPIATSREGIDLSDSKNIVSVETIYSTDDRSWLSGSRAEFPSFTQVTEEVHNVGHDVVTNDSTPVRAFFEKHANSKVAKSDDDKTSDIDIDNEIKLFNEHVKAVNELNKKNLKFNKDGQVPLKRVLLGRDENTRFIANKNGVFHNKAHRDQVGAFIEKIQNKENRKSILGNLVNEIKTLVPAEGKYSATKLFALSMIYFYKEQFNDLAKSLKDRTDVSEIKKILNEKGFTGLTDKFSDIGQLIADSTDKQQIQNTILAYLISNKEARSKTSMINLSCYKLLQRNKQSLIKIKIKIKIKNK